MRIDRIELAWTLPLNCTTTAELEFNAKHQIKLSQAEKAHTKAQTLQTLTTSLNLKLEA